MRKLMPNILTTLSLKWLLILFLGDIAKNGLRFVVKNEYYLQQR